MTRAGPGPRAPIGVFDSGLGGLTVVRALMGRMPHESFLYFGDTARVPYGPKSPETIRRYAREITTYLRDEGVKAVVVACNTATAHALSMLRDELSIPVIGVVEPGARAAAEATRTRRVGVIGTAGTIGSGAYERAIHTRRPDVQVVARACPLFVPLVEEGWLDTPATRLIAREYLSPLSHDGIDTLVLGCTHYPLLQSVIAETMGSSVQLVDSADAAAAETAAVLCQAGLTAGESARPTSRFVASDAPEQFLRAGQRFLGSAIERVETVTLG
jgi:glutamate racemase